ncbi:MAG: hypothetical protein MUE47_00390 [Acidobacteria bacterium]|nr:hypothetical protein [Acidobacteriota bacterium]
MASVTFPSPVLPWVAAFSRDQVVGAGQVLGVDVVQLQLQVALGDLLAEQVVVGGGVQPQPLADRGVGRRGRQADPEVVQHQFHVEQPFLLPLQDLDLDVGLPLGAIDEEVDRQVVGRHLQPAPRPERALVDRQLGRGAALAAVERQPRDVAEEVVEQRRAARRRRLQLDLPGEVRPELQPFVCAVVVALDIHLRLQPGIHQERLAAGGGL